MDTLIKELNYISENIDSSVSETHFHSGYELIYVTDGDIQMEIDGFLHNITAPSIVVLNPFEWHKIITASRSYKRYTLVLDAEKAERDIPPYLISMIKCRPNGLGHIVCLNENDALYGKNIFSLLQDSCLSDYAYRQRLISNEICSLLILMYRNSKTKYDSHHLQMMQVQKYFDENFYEIDSVHVVAQHFHISDSHLSRSFKAYSGYSPVAYLINTRLYNAQMLLENTNDSLPQICDKTGFHDVNNFIRQFKAKYGITPLSFRKKYSNKHKHQK